MSGPENKNLQLIERAVAIIDFISESTNSCGLGEVATTTGISKPSTHRILSTLQVYGVVVKDERSKYHIGPKMLHWAEKYRSHSILLQISEPYINEISEISGETVHLVSYENNKAYYIRKVESRHPLQMRSQEGDSLSIHSTAAGKAILSALSPSDLEFFLSNRTLKAKTPHTIIDHEKLTAKLLIYRQQGYSEEIEENENDIRCVAAPILNAESKPVGSVSIALPVYRSNSERAAELGEVLAKIVPQISARLGYSSVNFLTGRDV